MHAFVFVACPADIMRLLGLGAGWRGWAVGWGLASVREMALVAAMFAIGVAACDRGGGCCTEWGGLIAASAGIYRPVVNSVSYFPLLVLAAWDSRYKRCIRGSCMCLWPFCLCGSVVFW